MLKPVEDLTLNQVVMIHGRIVTIVQQGEEYRLTFDSGVTVRAIAGQMFFVLEGDNIPTGISDLHFLVVNPDNVAVAAFQTPELAYDFTQAIHNGESYRIVNMFNN